MAFREKIIWSTLVITLAIWGWYFAGFVTALQAGQFDQGAATGRFIVTVVLELIVQAGAAIVIAVSSGKAATRPPDDREKAFSLSAYRPAYIVLSACVVTLMLAGPILLRIANEWQPTPPAGLAPVLLGNALLASLVLAQVTHSGWQVLRYRMGG